MAPLPHQRLAPATRPAGSSSSEDSRIAWLCAATRRDFIGWVGFHRKITQGLSGYADPGHDSLCQTGDMEHCLRAGGEQCRDVASAQEQDPGLH